MPKAARITMGARLKKLRTTIGMTQNEFAKTIGTMNSNLNRIEAGDGRYVTISILRRLEMKWPGSAAYILAGTLNKELLCPSNSED